MIPKNGETLLSLKFFFKGPKYLKGSVDNLRNGIERFQKPMTYIVALKESSEGKEIY